MALYTAIFMGGTPAASDMLAAVIGLGWIIRTKTLRVRAHRQPRGLPRLRLISLAADPKSGTADSRAGTADGAGRDASPDDAVER